MGVWLTATAAWVSRAVGGLVRAAKTTQYGRMALIERRSTRGIVLLREWLSPQQREQFDHYNFFEVVGCDSGKSYRIQHGVSTNVIELDRNGRPRTGWCFVPEGNLVAGDVMLAQKIALETDERGVLGIAHQFDIPLPSNRVFEGPY